MIGFMLEDAQLEVVTLFAASLGKTDLAAHGPMLQLVLLLSSPVDALQQAATTRMRIAKHAIAANMAAFVRCVYAPLIDMTNKGFFSKPLGGWFRRD